MRPIALRTPLARILACLAISLVTTADAVARGRLALPKRWFYASFNLLVDKEIETLDAVMTRAAKAGYTGLLLADSKFGRLADMDARYFRHGETVKARARTLGLEIVPAVFPIGYAEGLLSQDPNLAEALPVQEALFVVKGGEARLVPDPAVALRGGDFADLAAWDWKDDTVVASDGAALVRDPRGRNARIVQKVKVHPFRAYHVAVRVKTQDFRGEPEVKVLAGKRTLSFANLHVAPTQDWTVHHLVFDSLEEEEVSLYLGAWGADTGSLWWDDASIEEAGPVNVVRRDGAPFVVRRERGAVLREGSDFEPVADPRMGTVPWRGGYELWHEAPAIRTKLPDGARLRVSWQYAAILLDQQVTVCLSEPRTLDLLRDQAKRMHALWHAKGYFMSHDEIRAGGTDDACARRNLSAGAILADNARACVKILRETNPGGDVYVWSDMFDPAHNAHADYYLVRGDLAGSWEGLDKDVIVACWYRERRDESLSFFAKRGHRTLLAGYYDAPAGRVEAETKEWLDAARKVEGTVGVMYTTWRRGYDDLERFEKTVEDAR